MRPINEAQAQYTGIDVNTSLRCATALTAEDKKSKKSEGIL